MQNFIYGERGKIGLIYPSTGWVMEPEFYAMAPSGVATYTTRFNFGNCNLEGLSSIRDVAIEATKLISHIPIDVIAFGCTSGSFAFGKDYNDQLIEDMERASGGLPCITTASAVVDALEALKVKNVAVVTPYVDEVNEQAKKFLNGYGYIVVDMIGMGFDHDKDIDNQSLETVYRFSKKVNTLDADALLLLCTGLRTVPIIDMLERDVGKPVVSAIQATFWKCLQMMKIGEKIKGYGELLSEY